MIYTTAVVYIVILASVSGFLVVNLNSTTGWNELDLPNDKKEMIVKFAVTVQCFVTSMLNFQCNRNSNFVAMETFALNSRAVAICI